MGQMAWLSYLVDTENEEELIKFLKDKGFKNPKFAAKEFLKAGEDLKQKEKQADNNPDDGSWLGR